MNKPKLSLPVVGAIAVGAATVGAFLLSAYQQMRAPEGELVGVAEFSAYLQAPTPNDGWLEKFLDSWKPEFQPAKPEDAKVFDEARNYLGAQLRFESRTRSMSSAFGPRGYWKFDIENAGDRAVSDVLLRVPETIAFVVLRDGRPDMTRAEPYSANVGPVSIGTLQPSDRATVHLWTTSFSSNPERISMTHDSGRGTFTYRLPVGPIGQWFERNYKNIIFGVVMSLLVALQLWLGRSIKSQPNPQAQEHTTVSTD